jgi:hypothetical protein
MKLLKQTFSLIDFSTLYKLMEKTESDRSTVNSFVGEAIKWNSQISVNIFTK